MVLIGFLVVSFVPVWSSLPRLYFGQIRLSLVRSAAVVCDLPGSCGSPGASGFHFRFAIVGSPWFRASFHLDLHGFGPGSAPVRPALSSISTGLRTVPFPHFDRLWMTMLPSSLGCRCDRGRRRAVCAFNKSQSVRPSLRACCTYEAQ